MAHIFISYSRVDTEFTERLVERLRRVYGLPNVWYDDELHGGQRWWQTILKQVAECDVFVYLLSNESVTSPYCQAEFEEARRLQKPIVTVQVRDRTRLSDELSEIHYVDMGRGINDDTLARLIRAINEGAKLPKKRRALWTPVTVLPVVPTNEPLSSTLRPDVDTPTLAVKSQAGASSPAPAQDGSRSSWRRGLVIAGMVLVALVVAAALLSSLSPQTNTATPTTAIALLESATATETNTPTITPIPSNTPTELPIELIVGTLDAQATVEQATLNAESTAAARATEYAVGTQNVIDQTATATLWTATPTANITASIEAYRTQQADTATAQFITGQTATADTWTDTPTPTATFTPTRTPTATFTPSPTPTLSPEQLASTPVARNADWTPITREFDGVAMVLVPAGSFVMGSTSDEIDAALTMCEQAADNNAVCQRSWFDDEAQNGDNTQTFAQSFWLDRTEVTRAQYERCVAAGACTETPASDLSMQPEQPINRVTWEQALAFCEWRGARLPTEAEWEYAARGPDRLIFPWGNEFDGGLANHCDSNCEAASLVYNLVNEENDDGHAATATVGSYLGGASWVGALDMSGNLWEWVSSKYRAYPYTADAERENDNIVGVLYMLRGGSFDNAHFDLRASDRGGISPDYLSRSFGFRCARSS